MYPNLNAEMARNNISTKSLAEHIGLSISATTNKLLGRNDFRLSEAMKIKAMFPGATLEYLFSPAESDNRN